MRRHAVFDRFGFLAATAVVAAHANAKAEGFRQRDVRFMLDLICNWIDLDSQSSGLYIQNTQVLRYLKGLELEGYLRIIKGHTRPLYRLTRPGLIELISRAVLISGFDKPDYFFFLYYFVSSYRPKIFGLVKAEGKHFPYALELELQSLLDSNALLDREIKYTERKLAELDKLIHEAKLAAQLTAESIRKNLSFDQIVARWEKEYPYALNSQKPLSELFAEISPDIAQWELETGNAQRVRTLWQPIRLVKAQYLDTLKKIRAG